jgi:DNA polymerase III subunit epsilon
LYCKVYTIIDIETTGLSPDREKITEIAVYVYDGKEIVDEFVSLVNPERSIPYFITRMTGITNEMVAEAPKFYEIAKRIIEITENRIFVAHNVEFDYGFIRNEFASLGYEFKRNKLCTVKLSKKILPGKRSYSLGKLTSQLGIEITSRHRAAGDALATVKLFDLLLREDAKSKPLIEEMAYHSVKNLHPLFNKKILDELPEKTGVYYFFDENNKLIYVGKSKNIRSRVMQHLNNNSTNKAIEMKNNIVDVSYEVTGSELVALLFESAEIKKHMPKYNRSQRRTSFHHGLYSFLDEHGYLNFEIRKNTGEEIPITSFNNVPSAKSFLERLREKHTLCQKLCGLYKHSGACFHHGIKECNGACVQQESAEDYNQRAQTAIKSMEYRHKNFLIIDKGREPNERAIIHINKGSYQGFGFADMEYATNSVDFLLDCVKSFQDNRDIQIIIKGYLTRNKVEKIVALDEN